MYHMRNFRRVGSHHTPPPDIAHPGAVLYRGSHSRRSAPLGNGLSPSSVLSARSAFVSGHITGFPSYFTGL